VVVDPTLLVSVTDVVTLVVALLKLVEREELAAKQPDKKKTNEIIISFRG
jgi:hypothetical protein